MSLISIRGLEVRYGGRRALHGIDLDIDALQGFHRAVVLVNRLDVYICHLVSPSIGLRRGVSPSPTPLSSRG